MSSDVIMTGCLSSGNKRNYRLWGTGRLTDCRSENPQQRGGTGRPAHFSFNGGSAKYVIDSPVVRANFGNTAPIFLFNNDAPAIVEIRNADIQAVSARLIVSEKVQPIITFVPPLPEQNIRVLRWIKTTGEQTPAFDISKKLTSFGAISNQVKSPDG
jgi:hypothetical protein